jgi:hypothetical protein
MMLKMTFRLPFRGAPSGARTEPSYPENDVDPITDAMRTLHGFEREGVPGAHPGPRC